MMTTIVQGSARVFRERGYWKATTNHIAQAAGVSVGTLYEYFPNKEALIAALLEEHLSATRAMLEAIAADLDARDEWPPLEAITRFFVEAVTAQHERDPALHRVLFEQVPLAAELVAASQQLERDLVRLVADILRRHPEVELANPEMSAAIAVYTIEALTHKLVIHPQPGMDRDVYCKDVATMVSGYLARR